MRVEVDDGDGAVGARDTAEERESDGVVTAEGDDAGEGLALQGWALLVGVGGWSSAQDAVVAVLDLLDGVGVVVPFSISIASPNYRSDIEYPYDVTGISPQSSTVAQLLKGFASRGTLYPPLKRTLREPLERESYK